MSAIVLTGLGANDPVPGVYVQVNFAQGPASGSGSVRTALLVGNKTTSGYATNDTIVYGPDTPTPIQTENDWIAAFGAGSELHRMFRRFTAVNKSTTLYGIAVTSSAGAQATGTVTIATTATGNGNVRIWVGDEFVDTPIANGNSPTTVAAAAVLNINSMLSWPVTAANSSGVITLTAKEPGPRGNDISYMTLGTAGIGMTITPGTDSFLTGGTTADSNTTALGTINASKYYYIVSAAHDATQFGAVASQVGTQALPLTGIRQRCFTGSIDTLSNTNTIAVGVNNARAEITWLQTANWTPAELAANGAALYALLENSGSVPRHNFSNFPSSATDSTLWKVPAPRTQANWPTRASLLSALNNGVTPIAVNTNGTTMLSRRITTYSVTSSVNDYRVRDSAKVTECDFYADDLYAKLVLQFGGKDIADDPAQGSPPPGPQVATVGAIKGAVNRLTQDYGDQFRMQNTSTIIANTIVARETNPTTRVSIFVPLQPVDILAQIAAELNQVA